MKKITTLIFAMLITSIVGFSQQKALFLRHSTGYNVYKYGNVLSALSRYNRTSPIDISLTLREYPSTPWVFNYPYDYWKLWVGGSCNSSSNTQCLSYMVANYNMIIFKHCYGASHILADTGTPDPNSIRESLENYKAQYRDLRVLMDSYPNTKFMVWTLTPLHRLATTPEEAERTHEFVEWVKNDWLTEDNNQHQNIFIFDFYGLTAELDTANQAKYCLKYAYEMSHNTIDTFGTTHVNLLGNQIVGPYFSQAIIDAFNYIPPVDTVMVDSINITSGSTTITNDNGTLQLSVAVYPSNATNKTVTWTVDSVNTASISTSGLLTALNNGTVVVRAVSNDGSNKTDSLVVTITNQTSFVPVQTITVSGQGGATSISVFHGTLQMNANVLPTDATNKTISWSVNNQNIATITSSGLLTAVNNGTVTVTATANDGSNVLGTIAIMITNQTQVVLVQSINIFSANGSSTISTNGGTLQLGITILPTNATNKTYTGSINVSNVITVSMTTGVVRAIGNGEATITATANDGSGVSGTFTVTVTNQLAKNAIIFNSEPDVFEKNNLWPNPTNDLLYVSIDGYNTFKNIDIFDVNGKIVLSKNNVDQFIDVSMLNNGLYLLRATSETSVTTTKFLINK